MTQPVTNDETYSWWQWGLVITPLVDDERGLGRGADSEGIIKETHHWKMEPVGLTASTGQRFRFVERFSHAVIASHASLFVLTSPCLPSTLAHIWSVHLLLDTALHKLLGVLELPVCVLCGWLAVTTGKQLSNEVTRFDVKWSVRLIGYASYMRDTCHTNLIFLKINNLCTDLILDTVHLHHRSW